MRKLFTVVVLLGLFLIGPKINAKKEKTIRQSEAFYVYDPNHALLTSTQYQIFNLSSFLYKKSLEVSKTVGGAQVVVVTLDENSTIDSDDIFNSWKIGKNEMGLLIVLYYDFTEEVPQLTSLEYNGGDQMSIYLPAIKFYQLYRDYVEPYMDEIAIMEFYYEIIKHIYDKAYNLTFTYNLNEYIETMYEYYKLPLSVYPQKEPLPVLLIVLIVLFIPTTAIGSVFVVKGIKGGGGRSFGYKGRI